MDLPQFPVFVSDTLVPRLWITAVALIHLFLAQLTVGGGILIAFFEWRAESGGNSLLRDFLHRFFNTSVLVCFLLGAVSGIGLWFVTALVTPRSHLFLLREFHWIWAAALSLFVFQVFCGYAYYVYGRTLPFRSRFSLASGYAVSAFLSLLLVNGILTFQLTPGEWLNSGALWDGLFNPTFWSSLLARVVASMALAALVASLVAQAIRSYDLADRREITRNASFLLIPLLSMPALALWFFTGIQESSRSYFTGTNLPTALFLFISMFSAVLVAGTAIFALLKRRSLVHLSGTVLLTVFAICAMGTTELIQASMRKPFAVTGVLYSNGIAVDEVRKLQRKGIDRKSLWPLRNRERYPSGDVRQGRLVYRELCAVCHTPTSLNGLVYLTESWDREMLERNLENLHRLKPFMPPFAGDEEDLEDLVDYLIWLREVE